MIVGESTKVKGGCVTWQSSSKDRFSLSSHGDSAGNYPLLWSKLNQAFCRSELVSRWPRNRELGGEWGRMPSTIRELERLPSLQSYKHLLVWSLGANSQWGLRCVLWVARSTGLIKNRNRNGWFPLISFQVDHYSILFVFWFFIFSEVGDRVGLN